ncbi:hypothetical protein PR001_g1843 [Phytophthora rubi]|uniref:Uncharacterized protein n=1 Tax=Phytophthora rubi TaxID=129364 RepID=A0A6A3P651_9STRA|nr:hypothetical protein PR001_g1843 [Phytophthora rubi]
MKAVICAVVPEGDLLVAFKEPYESIYAVLEVVQRELHCPAEQMTAFLARRRGGGWLTGLDGSRYFMKRGRIPEEEVRAIMTSANILNPHTAVGDEAYHFPDDTDVHLNEIHIVVTLRKMSLRIALLILVMAFIVAVCQIYVATQENPSKTAGRIAAIGKSLRVLLEAWFRALQAT